MPMSDRIAALIWGAVGLLMATLAFLAFLESYLYAKGTPRITTYVRIWATDHQVAAISLGMAVMVAAAVGFTHFVVDR